MADLIIVDGDTVTFLPNFGAALVVPKPTTISSTAATTKVGTKAPCLEGDEGGVESPGCQYSTVAFPTPGSGTLKIEKLNNDQLTTKTTIEGKKVILKGSMFDAVFEVKMKAQLITPTSTTLDTTPKYSGGKGSFVPTNATVFAT
jgi:hypothetical protein